MDDRELLIRMNELVLPGPHVYQEPARGNLHLMDFALFLVHDLPALYKNRTMERTDLEFIPDWLQEYCHGIPGPYRNRNQGSLVAMANGTTGPFGLDPTLRKALACLILHPEIGLAVVVGNRWSPSALRPHLTALAALQAAGRCCLFLEIHSNGRLSEVPFQPDYHLLDGVVEAEFLGLQR